MRHPTGDERQQCIVGGRQSRLYLGDRTIKLSAWEQQRKCLRPLRRHPVIRSGVLSSNSASMFEQSVEIVSATRWRYDSRGDSRPRLSGRAQLDVGRTVRVKSERKLGQCPAKPAQLR